MNYQLLYFQSEIFVKEEIKVTKKMMRDMERKAKKEERLKRKKDKRKKYELQRKLRSVTLPENDIRRTMVQTMNKYCGNRDYESMRKFFEENAVPQFLTRIQTVSNIGVFIYPFVCIFTFKY